jgi:hypothetical protein
VSDPKDLLRAIHKSLWPNGAPPDLPAPPEHEQAIAPDTEPEDRPVAAKKKKTAKKKTPAKKAPVKPVPEQLETDTDLEHVKGPFCKGGFPSESIKLKGKDELVIVHCDACKCSHYYLAQPAGKDRFTVHELILGEEVCWAPKTPSGDMDTETAMEHLEDDVEEHDGE